jgi:maltooligosyltrehalose trehalohydrolase
MKYGYLYQGQWYKWQKKRRGTSTADIEPSAFVTFIQNHDQVANSLRGNRVHNDSSPGLLRALTAFILLGPGTPMLFQGQEFASSAPFQYFADVPERLAKLVRDGRQKFLSQWRSIKAAKPFSFMPDPCSRATFDRCKLDHTEREQHASIYALHRDLLRLRRDDTGARWHAGNYDGAVLGSHAFLLRAFDEQGDDRLLVVNLGVDLHLDPAPEPLLAPPDGTRWRTVFSTEDPCYGGYGTAPLDSDGNWQIPGRAAVLLAPTPQKDEEESFE